MTDAQVRKQLKREMKHEKKFINDVVRLRKALITARQRIKILEAR